MVGLQVVAAGIADGMVFGGRLFQLLLTYFCTLIAAPAMRFMPLAREGNAVRVAKRAIPLIPDTSTALADLRPDDEPFAAA